MFALALPAFVLVVAAGIAGWVLAPKSRAGELVRTAFAVAAPVVLLVALLGRALFHGMGARAGIAHGAVVGDLCMEVPLTPVADQAAAWACSLVVWMGLFGLGHHLRQPRATTLASIRRGPRGRWIPSSLVTIALVSLLATGPLEGPGCGFPAYRSVVELPRGVWNLGSPRFQRVTVPPAPRR